MDWERIFILCYIDLEGYLEAESSGAIPGRGRDIFIFSKVLIRSTENRTNNGGKCGSGPLQRLKLKKLMSLPFARDPEDLK